MRRVLFGRERVDLDRLHAGGVRLADGPGLFGVDHAGGERPLDERVVYFGADDVFRREDVSVPVFQKEAPGNRIVCYCFGIGESDLRREIATTGRSTAAARIALHVREDRCACELRNPQGSCYLGNIVETARPSSASRRGG